MSKLVHQITFIPGMRFSEIAKEEDMKNSLVQLLNTTSEENEWEVYQIEETVRSDGTQGLLVFYKRPYEEF